MDSLDPAAYLPHRPPFLFLDRLLTVESGVSATARLQVTGCPEGYPPILLVESVAQLGGIAAAREGDAGGILAAIDRAEFHGIIANGESLTVTARIAKSFGPLHLVEGEVTGDGGTVATITLTLKVGPLP
ncbi:hydroxymyristoyl-ACP dehydratase [Geobacter pickeringii]|uniref:Hydroxymyristoyl-ACP dehydratase n=1 Tax=Geobacter pickeringii TaxID=345632 RepID=A0A0B5BLM3_9BACT|nr:hydroxymyristoyl-ACP dehydratase [Geobacter pickeringii]